MNSPRDLLAAIAAVPLRRPVRVLTLCSDHERVIAASGMRRFLPERIRLLSGPGSAASLCPMGDLYQAIQLATRHPVTLLAAEGLLSLPVDPRLPGPHSLAQAAQTGADVRPVADPIEAVIAAHADPGREMVLFAAGFETLLAPLAGMILEGLPKNLSVLLCGRRVQPLLEEVLLRGETGCDALLLPGNRCAVTGIEAWEQFAAAHRVPAAVAGNTVVSILSALHGLLRQHLAGEVRVENFYRALVRPEGQALARDSLERVFELVEGCWRGVGKVGASAFRLRHAYRVLDANHRYRDYRGEVQQAASEMPPGCECAAVLLGRKAPTDCTQFAAVCHAATPYGPCMASDDGPCRLRSEFARAA